MKAKQRSILTNLNRVLILVLSLISIMMDGTQYSNLPSTIALIVWLWLPTCTRLEENILQRLMGKRSRLVSES